MKKSPLLTLILLAIITACRPQPSLESPPILTQRPTEYSTYTPIPDEVQEQVKEKLSYALDNLAYVEQESPDGEIIHYYQLIGLSTGELHTLELNGYRLDVLDIYLMMIPGPLSIPVVVGVEDLQEGTYTSLIAGYQDSSRPGLLDEVATLYPRWQEVMVMLMGDTVTSNGVNWEACSDDDPLHCEIGQALEDTYQAEMQLLRIQALDRVPQSFALPWTLMPPLPPVEPFPTLSPSEIKNSIPAPGGW